LHRGSQQAGFFAATVNRKAKIAKKIEKRFDGIYWKNRKEVKENG
jgi:hypothetical protein